MVDNSKIVLRYTPNTKPKPSACSHGCTINRESKEFNQTHCTRTHVVDSSKMVLRFTPKPSPSACCHGCTINRESRNSTRPIVNMWLIVPRWCWGTHQTQTLKPKPSACCHGCTINRCMRVVDHSPRWCWGRHQSHSHRHAAMDAPSTENQGIQPYPLYACGWSFSKMVLRYTPKPKLMTYLLLPTLLFAPPSVMVCHITRMQFHLQPPSYQFQIELQAHIHLKVHDEIVGLLKSHSNMHDNTLPFSTNLLLTKNHFIAKLENQLTWPNV